MRGYTRLEFETLEDAAQPPITAEESAIIEASGLGRLSEFDMSPAEVHAALSLQQRGCIVEIRHSWGETHNITARGRIALAIARALPNG